MKLYRFTDRSKLYAKIYIYLERREEMKKRYKGNSRDYKMATRNIDNKLMTWRRGIKMIDERQNKIIAIANLLCLFMGENVKDGVRYTSDKAKLARHIFYKYCLENRIPSTLVADYVGASRQDVVTRGREAFTRSFQAYPHNREMYNRFKSYIQEEQERGVDQPTKDSL